MLFENAVICAREKKKSLFSEVDFEFLIFEILLKRYFSVDFCTPYKRTKRTPICYG